MDKPFAVTIMFDIKKDGKDFSQFSLAYDNLPYSYMYEFEKLGGRLVAELIGWGKANIPKDEVELIPNK